MLRSEATSQSSKYPVPNTQIPNLVDESNVIPASHRSPRTIPTIQDPRSKIAGRRPASPHEHEPDRKQPSPIHPDRRRCRRPVRDLDGGPHAVGPLRPRGDDLGLPGRPALQARSAHRRTRRRPQARAGALRRAPGRGRRTARRAQGHHRLDLGPLSRGAGEAQAAAEEAYPQTSRA